jgi:uncharacterized membrane protein YeaQ/YmgE (transglycosylase-associated protein family)
MHLIATFLLGFFVGLAGKLLMPRNDPGGILITSMLGIVGAFLARYFRQELGGFGAQDSPGFLTSVLGAAALLLLYRLLFHHKYPANRA